MIKRYLPVGPVGHPRHLHAGEVLLAATCSSYMKSHTANTWCSRKGRIAGPRVQRGVHRVLDDRPPCLADLLLKTVDSGDAAGLQS